MKCDKRSVRRYSLLLFSCLPYNSEILFDPFSVFSLILICKTLVTPSGVATATARRCYFSQSAVRSQRILICSRRWRCHGVLTSFPRRSHDVSTKFHGVLVGDCLRSHGVLTALPLRALSCHGAHSALTAGSLNN